MSLFGSRTTLIANISGLVVASVIVVEAAYIEHKGLGVHEANDYWSAFIPIFIMFVIRNRIFSWCFLLLYVALASQMFYQAYLIFFDNYGSAPRGGPLGYMRLFLLISLGCLGIYAMGVLVWFANSLSDSRK